MANVYEDFWNQFEEVLASKTDLLRKDFEVTRHWARIPTRSQFISYLFVVNKNRSKIELYIDGQQQSGRWCDEVFQELKEHQTEIEDTLGQPLEWDDSAKESCKIRTTIPNGWEDRDNWPTLQDQMVQTMMQFRSALRPFLADSET